MRLSCSRGNVRPVKKLRPSCLLFTCEHASNRVPSKYKPLFAGCEALLASHRGWDPGTLPLGRTLANNFDAPLLATNATRLLIEPNRSLHHLRLFSDVTRELPAADKQQIVEQWYMPHREAVIAAIGERVQDGQCVIHIGVHSFTPVFEGEERQVDLGLLYDPKRAREKTFCAAWAKRLRSQASHLRVRMNQPYRGAADGLTTTMRKQFAPDTYLGIEIEVNQRLLQSGSHVFELPVTNAIVASLEVLAV